MGVQLRETEYEVLLDLQHLRRLSLRYATAPLRTFANSIPGSPKIHHFYSWILGFQMQRFKSTQSIHSGVTVLHWQGLAIVSQPAALSHSCVIISTSLLSCCQPRDVQPCTGGPIPPLTRRCHAKPADAPQPKPQALQHRLPFACCTPGLTGSPFYTDQAIQKIPLRL